jgi:hypothetical protein
LFFVNEKWFIFREKGVSIVEPDTTVRVVLFGWWLDEVILIGFTKSDSCTDTLFNVSQADFTVQTERRLVIDYSFPIMRDATFKVCMKQKPRESKEGETIEMPYIMVSLFVYFNGYDCLD